MRTFFIIDDDANTLKRLTGLMNEYSEYRFLGASSSSSESMNLILKESPDLVFLNVDGLINNPFNFVNETISFQKRVSKFIGISVDKQHAYQALKNDFIDFLLKPLSELEIRKSVLKYSNSCQTALKQTICLKSYKDYQYLNTADILFLKADNNTTDFHMKDGTIISAYKTLKTFETLLPDDFIRIHKSYIINKSYVSRINYGKLMCSIDNLNYRIPFTKTYLENIKYLNKTLTESSLLSLN